MTVAIIPPPCWWNIWIDCDGKPRIETVFRDEAECLGEIAEQDEGYVWRGHAYGGTVHFKNGVAAWADRKDGALAAAWEQLRQARADRAHERAAMGAVL